MGDDDVEAHRLRSDSSIRPRHAVIAALAEVQNTDPTDVEPDLYGEVELEVLDTLLLHCRDADVSVTFSVSGRTVAVWVECDHVVVEVTDEGA